MSRVTEPIALGFGSFALKPTPLAVVQSATDLTPQTGIDGLLGTSALAAYDVDIDMPRKRLALNEPRRCPLGPAPFEGPSTTFQAPPNPRNYFYVPVRVEQRDLSLLVDTGANRTYLNEARTGLPSAELSDDRAISIRSAGPAGVTARLHRFGEFRLGQETHHNIALLVGPLQIGGDGLLGTDFWRSRRIWLSFAGWAITIEQRDTHQR